MDNANKHFELLDKASKEQQKVFRWIIATGILVFALFMINLVYPGLFYYDKLSTEKGYSDENDFRHVDRRLRDSILTLREKSHPKKKNGESGLGWNLDDELDSIIKNANNGINLDTNMLKSSILGRHLRDIKNENKRLQEVIYNLRNEISVQRALLSQKTVLYDTVYIFKDRSVPDSATIELSLNADSLGWYEIRVVKAPDKEPVRRVFYVLLLNGESIQFISSYKNQFGTRILAKSRDYISVLKILAIYENGALGLWEVKY